MILIQISNKFQQLRKQGKVNVQRKVNGKKRLKRL